MRYFENLRERAEMDPKGNTISHGSITAISGTFSRLLIASGKPMSMTMGSAVVALEVGRWIPLEIYAARRLA